MSQYRFGTFTAPSTAAAQTITLGFVPSKFKLVNYTGYATATVVSEAEFNYGMAAGYALIKTTSTDADVTGVYQVPSILTSNGFTTFNTGASWTATQATISAATKANPCVITATAHGFSTGDTVTISGVRGMTQLNANRYLITVVDANSFSLRDLFGNAVDSSAYGTYTSGGIANKISSSSTPPGNQYDTGSSGIILGTSLFRNNADVFYWEAWTQTPTGW
jgi:hypothetical protein